MSFLIDRSKYSSYNTELEEHKHYVKYDKENEEITFTVDQLNELLYETYEDGRLEN